MSELVSAGFFMIAAVNEQQAEVDEQTTIAALLDLRWARTGASLWR